MKKKLLLALLIIGIAAAGYSQPRAIGARAGYNFELSYQHTLSNNMLEIDLGVSPFLTYRELSTAGITVYHYGRVQVVAAYDWINNISGNFNWYVGLAAGICLSYGEYYEMMGFNRFGIPVGGQVGLEYNFKIPLNLSIDWRPMINVFGLRQGNFRTNLFNLAISARYRF